MKSLNTRSNIMRRLVLLLSGLIAVAIAVTILFLPEFFYASYGIEVAGDAALKNELKAPSGLLLAGGALMLLGAFRVEWTTHALVAAAVVYLSYGFSRVASFALDGMPGRQMAIDADLRWNTCSGRCTPGCCAGWLARVVPRDRLRPRMERE